MKYNDTWGQCDAITSKGHRCARRAMSIYPSGIKGELKNVNFCFAHWLKEGKARCENHRIKLHHGGWFGAYNKHKYGNLVIDKPNVNWDKAKILRVPKYWSGK